MSTSSTPRPHVELDRDHVLDDDLPVDPDATEPEHHRPPIEVPEADAADQEREVPLDDDRR
jgi:hypothetical protein